MRDKIEKKFPSSENCLEDVWVTGSKTAHILTIVMPTLRLPTLSGGWQVHHGIEAVNINL
jgi:hypothetical protein